MLKEMPAWPGRLWDGDPRSRSTNSCARWWTQIKDPGGSANHQHNQVRGRKSVTGTGVREHTTAKLLGPLVAVRESSKTGHPSSCNESERSPPLDGSVKTFERETHFGPMMHTQMSSRQTLL